MNQSKSIAKEINTLDLHESYNSTAGNMNLDILRVPGGWIYTITKTVKAITTPVKETKTRFDKQATITDQWYIKTITTSTFIPFNAEFNR